MSVRTAHQPPPFSAYTQRRNRSVCSQISLVLWALWAESSEFFVRLLEQDLSQFPPWRRLTVVYHSADWRPLCLSPRILRHWVPTAKMKHYEVSVVCETLNLQWTASQCTNFNLLFFFILFSTTKTNSNHTRPSCCLQAISIEAGMLLRLRLHSLSC